MPAPSGAPAPRPEALTKAPAPTSAHLRSGSALPSRCRLPPARRSLSSAPPPVPGTAATISAPAPTAPLPQTAPAPAGAQPAEASAAARLTRGTEDDSQGEGLILTDLLIQVLERKAPTCT